VRQADDRARRSALAFSQRAAIRLEADRPRGTGLSFYVPRPFHSRHFPRILLDHFRINRSLWTVPFLAATQNFFPRRVQTVENGALLPAVY